MKESQRLYMEQSKYLDNLFIDICQRLPSSKLLSIIIIIPDSNQLFTQATYILQQKCG